MRIREDGSVAWSERLPKRLVRALYESDASGLVDGELLDRAGMMLYARCLDILYIRDFLGGAYRCPRCELRIGRGSEMGDRGCPACGFALSAEELRGSFRKRQLNPGGAVPAFQKFINEWTKASTASAKMLAIDAVIHSFHYSLAREPDLPTRAAGVNLIEGRLKDVLEFLDELSEGRADETTLRYRRELARNRALWG